MQQSTSSPLIDGATSGKSSLWEILTAAAVLAAAAAVYLLLFNRSNVLSHSIGYNLYASQRVLEGDVPYRDFHTLYPPAIFYLNALLFKLMGVSLYTALLGVLIFKSLTVLAIYLSGRQAMPTAWALAAALAGLLWLRPNGPFKSVPMHYGALFLSLAMLLLLKHENRRRLSFIFAAGASLGLVALLKHNIGAYALLGTMVLLLAEEGSFTFRFTRLGSYRRLATLLGGFAAAILPALVFMQTQGALVPMIRTLLFGPGEFLLNRLQIPLSPIAPGVLVAALAITAYGAYRLRHNSALAICLWLVPFSAVSFLILKRDQSDINQIIFYLPMMVLGAGLLVIFNKRVEVAERRKLLIVFIFAAAAFMELFPRFAREQSIAAMPLVMLFLFCGLYELRVPMRTFFPGIWEYRLALAVLPLIFLLVEGRLFFNTYFDESFRLRAGSQLSIPRGRGVYFPERTAKLIEEVVEYLEQHLPPGGYAFAQSDAGTSLLFLSDRRNISNAQFWVGVGVTQEERAATLERIDKSQTKLIITSDEVLAAEKYEPIRDYIDRNFKSRLRFDDVLILER